MRRNTLSKSRSRSPIVWDPRFWNAPHWDINCRRFIDCGAFASKSFAWHPAASPVQRNRAKVNKLLSLFDRLSSRLGYGILLLSFAALGTAGCAHVNDPYKDSSAAIDADMTTPTAQDYRGASEFGRPVARSWERSHVTYTNGAVTHWPLWWEDPFEDKGNRDRPTISGDENEPDNVFAWNWVDYLHMGYGPARYFLNTIGWPVSAVVTPPGTLMESDGYLSRGLLGYDHDAQRADSVTREPPDVSVLDRRPFKSDAPEAEASYPAEQDEKQDE